MAFIYDRFRWLHNGLILQHCIKCGKIVAGRFCRKCFRKLRDARDDRKLSPDSGE